MSDPTGFDRLLLGPRRTGPQPWHRRRALCDQADRSAAMPGEPVVIYTDEVRDALDGEA